MKVGLLSVLLLWACACALPGQRTPQRLVLTGIADAQLSKRWQRRWTPASDSSQAVAQIADGVLAALRAQGYAEAHVRQLQYNGTRVQALLVQGPRYVWDSLEINGLPASVYADLNLNSWCKPGQPYVQEATEQRLRQILHAQEQVGYPYASLSPPELHYRQHAAGEIGVVQRCNYASGVQVVIDSVVLAGRVREPASFVGQLVRIRPGMLYNQQAIARAPAILNNSIYYQNAQAARVRMYGKRAVVELPLQAKRNNRFDLLLGFLPPTQAGQAWQFTGLLDLQLTSALRAGEVLSLKYEQLPVGGRKLDLRYSHPYLFGTPLRAELRFDLLQQDTLWITRNFEPTLYYAFSTQLSIKAYYRSRTSNIISTAPYRQLRWPPPPVLDGRSSSWGLGLEFDNTDYRANPTRGVSLAADVGLGDKVIQRTRGLDSLDYARLLSSQQRVEIRIQSYYYRRLWSRQVAVLGLRAYWLGMNEYFENDLALLGGARTLRGFNENQFLASAYVIATAEYRLLLEQNAYLGGFVDYAVLQRQSFGVVQQESVLGTGVSLQLQTQAGLFNISYAMGQGAGQNLSPIQGRIHLGYIATF